MVNEEKKEEYLKFNFFKKMWYSICKFEKYPEMAALGVKKAIIYFTELMLIFSVIYVGLYAYHINTGYKNLEGSFSEKVVQELTKLNSEDVNEELQESIDQLKNTSTTSMAVTIFISIFIAIYITTFFNIVMVSIFGVVTCVFAKIKMNYKAVFNMSIYSLTLSITLKLIYLAINIISNFEMQYFDIMYMTIAYISLAAAIFMIKSDIIKQNLELIKIIEENKNKIEDKIIIPKKQKEGEKEENKEENEGKDKKEKDEKNDAEGQNSNA